MMIKKIKEFLLGVLLGGLGIVMFLLGKKKENNIHSKASERLVEKTYKKNDKTIKEADKSVREAKETFHRSSEAASYLNDILHNNKHRY